MEVRAKKSLGQHFLTDQGIARNIVDALKGTDVLEVGPGMGVLTQYLIPRFRESLDSPVSNPSVAGPGCETTATLGKLRGRDPSLAMGGAEQCEAVWQPGPATDGHHTTHLKAIEIDKESVEYLKKHYPDLGDGLIEGDFLKMNLSGLFPGQFSIIGNFPYNISSQIFFKILEFRDLVPEVVCMIQKEVAERIAEKPGTKTYGILSVFLQAWYDIDYLFTVGPGAFNPPPKVHSAVIRLTRNSRTSLGCDEKLFRTVVKTSFGQRRKTLRNSLKPLIRQVDGSIPSDNRPMGEAVALTDPGDGALYGTGRVHSRFAAAEYGLSPSSAPAGSGPETDSGHKSLADPVFDLRPERLSVEDFIALTLKISQLNAGVI